jgi:glucose/arabinose dehydrogenase
VPRPPILRRAAAFACDAALLLAVALILAAAVAFVAAPARGQTLPTDFIAENLVPGDVFEVPTSIAFLPDRRLLVAEKRGRVWMVENGVRRATPVWADEARVLDDGDRGVLGVAVDPRYFLNHYVYVLFTVDPDSNGVDNNSDGYGRLVRYQMSAADSNVVDPSTRVVLFGTDWRSGPIIGSVTHTVGALRWGQDGSLLVTAGDGAQFTSTDPGGLDPEMFGPGLADPVEDIGAFRSQWLGSLAGKLLRINPSTGHGYASNPYADANLASVRSRVWAYGLRNPFRFCVRPGSGVADTAAGRPGSVYLGDVGWATWEEMNIARDGGENFGWPCMEGPGPAPGYPSLDPPRGGCDSVGTPWNPAAFTAPPVYWNHNSPALSQPPGVLGNASVGGAFYGGYLYPGAYRGRYFFADFAASWMRTAIVDTLDQVVAVLDFGQGMDGPVDLAVEPVTGDICYVSINTGEIRRIRYTGENPENGPPVAAVSASPSAGVAPLSVDFSSLGSFDPEGGPLAYAWAFGDQQGSTLAHPTHVYAAPGNYAAVLTVTDTTGAVGRDTVVVVVADQISFPSTPVLDTFDRPDGPLGAPWTGNLGGLAVADSGLAPLVTDTWAVWDGGVFGPTQECYVTFDAVTAAAPEHDLMLKVQGTDWSAGYIEVRYDAEVGLLRVSTYTLATSWVLRGGPWPIAFGAGDQLGARAYPNGAVDVFKNGALIGSCSTGDWPFGTAGGRIGLLFWEATSSRLQDFGGGDAVLDPNTAPEVAILSPLDGAFFAHDDTVWLARSVTDAQDPEDSLAVRWHVNLRHNNHTHPDAFTSDSASAFFVAENHDDGTGTWYEILCVAEDRGGLRDTARAEIWPAIDLEPEILEVEPAEPGSASPMQVTFRLRNRGPMPSSRSRWALTADAVTLAEGDTLVAAGDSLTLAVVIPPGLAPGDHTLRLTADTLAAVRETDEANNADARALTVVPGSVSAPPGPARLWLSAARPNPARGSVAFALELPWAARVSFAVYDLLGREVWREDLDRSAGRWTLTWPGTGRDGAPAHAGVYLMRVRAGDAAFTRRVAMVR